jgi:peroxiredoxin
MAVQIGDRLPDIELPTLESGVWRISEQIGCPIVLFCFATW